MTNDPAVRFIPLDPATPDVGWQTEDGRYRVVPARRRRRRTVEDAGHLLLDTEDHDIRIPVESTCRAVSFITELRHREAFQHDRGVALPFPAGLPQDDTLVTADELPTPTGRVLILALVAVFTVLSVALLLVVRAADSNELPLPKAEPAKNLRDRPHGRLAPAVKFFPPPTLAGFTVERVTAGCAPDAISVVATVQAAAAAVAGFGVTLMDDEQPVGLGQTDDQQFQAGETRQVVILTTTPCAVLDRMTSPQLTLLYAA